MKTTKILLLLILVLAVTIPLGFVAAKGPPNKEETAGNNLSFPVIWAEGVTKALPGTAGEEPALGGVWWYQWGTNGVDPDVTPASCPPDPDNESYCDDGIPLQFNETLVPGQPPADNSLPLAKAYLQKDPLNTWQAWSGLPVDARVAQPDGKLFVDRIDWGDNLESVDWYTKSQVRTEVVLFQFLPDPIIDKEFLEYAMRHTSGWGINEVHGLAAVEGTVQSSSGERATVFSPCARFMIQLLLVDRDDPGLENLEWVPQIGWTEPEGYPDLINPPIFNKVVYEAGDGPGFYNAEINVKGRIIYGYTWNVRNLHDDALNEKGAGDYRLTFSFDQVCGGTTLNTFFADGVTQIEVPLETEEALDGALATSEEGEEPGGGAQGVLVPAEFDEFGVFTGNGNLTYMDVRILERSGGGGGGGGGKPSRSNDLPLK